MKYFRMGGLYILIAFVVVFVVIAILIAVVCYSRSKKQQHKEEQLASNYAYSNYGGSQVIMNSQLLHKLRIGWLPKGI